MKVFAMNDCDWMAGESLESVTAEYLKEYAGGNNADEALDEPHELSEDAMNRMKFTDGEPGEGGPVRSFRAQLDKMIAEGQKFPCFFATTEY